MELPPEDFERQIFIKQNAAWLLEQELRQVRPHEEIALGTATDPYQPVERRARVTRVTARSAGPAARPAHRGGHEINADRTRHSFAAENRGEKYAGAAFDDYYPERRVGPVCWNRGRPGLTCDCGPWPGCARPA